MNLYTVKFIKNDGQEEMIFTTPSLERAKEGADINHSALNARGTVVVELDGQVVYTPGQ